MLRRLWARLRRRHDDEPVPEGAGPEPTVDAVLEPPPGPPEPIAGASPEPAAAPGPPSRLTAPQPVKTMPPGTVTLIHEDGTVSSLPHPDEDSITYVVDQLLAAQGPSDPPGDA